MANERFHTITKYTTLEDLARIQENWDTANADLTELELADEAESIARTAGDANEATARAAADTAEQTARIAADASEASARQAGDAGLQVQITANGAAITALQGKDIQHEASIADLQGQITVNETDIEAKLQAHKDAASAHDADNIGFIPGTSGLAATKAGPAIKEVNQRITTIVAGAGASNTEILDARGGFGTLKARLDDGDLYQAAIDTARADMERQRSYSGVLDYIATLVNSGTTSFTGRGQIGYLLAGASGAALSILLISRFAALVNGYKTEVTDFNNTAGSGYSRVVFLAPPTYGTRDDLAFLEGYFPTTGPKGQMSWRLRTVAGVDFATNPEGMRQKGTDWSKTIVTAQGGNASPLAQRTGAADATWFNTYFAQTSDNPTPSSAAGDNGLYIAGQGDTTSKTLLATADGYSYAIPLFKVKRRNSGGWRADNPNGARDFYSFTTDSVSTVSANAGDVVTMNLVSGSTVSGIGMKLGDKIGSTSSSYRGDVIEIVTNTQYKIRLAVALNFVTGNPFTWQAFSDRPDGLFSNIIDTTDITDLRHRIPVAFNPNGELEGGFDTTIRGALTTKDTVTMIKDGYGLQRAPLGLGQQLQPVTIKRADGTTFDAINIMGPDGSFEKDGGGGYGVGWVKVGSGSPSPSLDTANVRYGTKSQKLVKGGATTFGVKYYPPFEAGKKYIVVADIYYASGSGTVSFGVSSTDGSFNLASTPITAPNGGFKTYYVKVTIPSGGYNVQIFPVTDTVYMDGVRVIPVSDAEYALIDVNSSWIGGDNIAALYPPLDSLPNFAENLFDGQIETGYIVSGLPTASASLNRSVNYTRVVPSTFYYINSPLNTSGNAIAAVHFYDASNTFISSVGDVSGVLSFTTPSNCVYVKFFTAFQYGTLLGTNIYISTTNLHVPYGRHYLPSDYQGNNAHLGNNSLIHYDGVNGTTFHSNRSVFSDAQTSETRTDIVDVLRTPQSHVKVTQATEGQWASGDTIKFRQDYGVITGVIDADTALARVADNAITSSTSPVTIKVDDVSRLAVGDKLTKVLSTDLSVSSAFINVDAIDTTNKTITISWSGGAIIFGTDYFFIENTTATSVPVVVYTPQQAKTAQSGSTGTTIKLASDASATDSYYNGLTVTITGGTGAGQIKTINGYVGSTKVATVSAWSVTPDATSVYSISMPGAWTNLGTKEATFTVGTMPTATDGTLGNANKLNPVMTYSSNFTAGKGMTNLPRTIWDAYVNGQRNVSGTTVTVKANLVGKISGNTDANPNKSFNNSISTTLQVPGGSWGENAQAPSDQITALDGITRGTGASGAGAIAQHMFSFDLIRTIEDKFGEIPGCQTVAEKVAWLKAGNVTALSCDWWGYGTCPSPDFTGAFLRNWDGTAWSTDGVSPGHGNATVSKLTKSGLVASIDANGTVFFLANARPSDGTTASVINTDYVELSITLNMAETGYTVLQPENPFPILSENIFESNIAFPVDMGSMSGVSASVSIDSLGILKAVTNNLTANEGIFFPTTPVLQGKYYTVSVKVKGVSGVGMRLQAVNGGSNTVITTKTFTASGDWDSIVVSFVAGASVVYFYIQTNTQVTTTFYAQRIKLQEGVVVSPSWSSGRKKKVTLNMLGKRSGSLVEIPHRYMYASSSTFGSPSTFTLEHSQIDYDSVGKQDGVITITSTAAIGQYIQELWEFDLSHLGMSLTELKKAIRKFTITCVGYGVGDNAGVAANGVSVRLRNTANGVWSGTVNDTGSSTPTTVNFDSTLFAVGLGSAISPDQKVYVMIHSQYPAGTASVSTINTDYVKLGVELADYVDYVKANVVKVRSETKEIKLAFPARSYKLLGGGANSDVVSLNYQYLPYQGQVNISRPVIRILNEFPYGFATNKGTGGRASTFPASNGNPLTSNAITNLPIGSGVQDSDFINDTFVVAGMRFEDARLRKLSNNFSYDVPGGYNTIQHIDANINFAGSTNANRGWKHTGSTISLPSILFEPITSMSGGRLLYVAAFLGLIVGTGELCLVIITRTSSAIVANGGTDCAVDYYRLPGRPLLKGV